MSLSEIIRFCYKIFGSSENVVYLWWSNSMLVCWWITHYGTSTAGNRHKQNSWFCKEIREDNFRFWWRRVHKDASQGMYMTEIDFFHFYCSNIAKSENAMLWRMLSRLETYIVYSCIWSVTLAKSIVPRKTWRKLWHSYIF